MTTMQRTKLPWRIALEPIMSYRGEAGGAERGVSRILEFFPARDGLTVQIKFDGLVVGEAILRVGIKPKDLKQRETLLTPQSVPAEEIIFRKKKVGSAIEAISRFPHVVWEPDSRPVQFPAPRKSVPVNIDVARDGSLTVKAIIQGHGIAPSRAVGESPCWIWSGAMLMQVGVRVPASVLDLLLQGIDVPARDQAEFLRDYLPMLKGAGLEIVLNGESLDAHRATPRTFLTLHEDKRGLWAHLTLGYGKQEVSPLLASGREEPLPWQQNPLKEDTDSARSRVIAPPPPADKSKLSTDSRPEELLVRDLDHERRMVEMLDDLYQALMADREKEPRRRRAVATGETKDKALVRGTVTQIDPATLFMSGQVALRFLFDVIGTLPDDVKVRGREKLKMFDISHESGEVDLNVGIRGKQIRLTGELRAGQSSASVTGLVKALGAGSPYVRLDSGKIIRLPSEWVKLDTWSRLAREAPASTRKAGADQGLKLPLHLIGWVMECRDIASHFTESSDWLAFKDRLLSFKGIQPIPPPEGLHTKLRHYQEQCLSWLSFLQEHELGGVLADDMGLGKTVQALALLLTLKEKDIQGTTLVVCPTSVIENWKRETGRFTPALKVAFYHGRDRHKVLEEYRNYDILLTTYGILRRDLKPLRKKKFLYVILDESQNIKSLSTATTLSALNIDARHRLCMTGTPVENSPLELYSQLNFLMPGILGSVRRFKKTFLEGDPLARSDRVDLLRNRVKPFILRRTKAQVTPELPEKQEIQLTCELEGATLRVYREILALSREEVFTSVNSVGIGKSQMTILQALLRLRQLCCHPALLAHLDPTLATLPSPKMDLLLETLEEIISEGHRVLVFSQFTSLLALIRGNLEKQNIPYLYMDGKTRQRQALVDRFNLQTDEAVFLISLKAGGTGLNLTGADYVIHYDPWWNPAVMDQATARTHRIGQTRKVFAYNLVVKDSIEEKVISLAQRKRELAEELIPTDFDFSKRLTRQDLEELFSPLP